MTSTHCIVIPHYRHVPQLRRFLPKLEVADLPVVVVDDGSGDEVLGQLQKLIDRYSWVSLIKLDTNGGKGAATLAGLAGAQKLGFTHVILVDADGQHDPEDVARIHLRSQQQPKAIFSGHPQFGSDIPAARLYGREITNALARIESGNLQLKDAMCGLRVYPIGATLKLCQQCRHRLRMEMDTELLVRACWQGIPVRYLETKVVYPEEGASHFRMGKDNLRMVFMHITLLFSALYRVPLAKLKARKTQQQDLVS